MISVFQQERSYHRAAQREPTNHLSMLAERVLKLWPAPQLGRKPFMVTDIEACGYCSMDCHHVYIYMVLRHAGVAVNGHQGAVTVCRYRVATDRSVRLSRRTEMDSLQQGRGVPLVSLRAKGEGSVTRGREGIRLPPLRSAV